MATTPAHHAIIELQAGDDWLIEGTLLSMNGTIFNPSGADIIWVLISPDGKNVDVSNVVINRNNSLGTVTITLMAEHTASLPPGRYSDALRIVDAGRTSLFWVGQIIVNANPEMYT